MTDAPLPLETPKTPLSAKERMAIGRVEMPAQDPAVRAGNFEEVNQGLTFALAMLEAERCLQCPKPYCIDGCPVRVDIPRFLRLLREGDLDGAAKSLLADNALPCVTGRVCPQEIQCEALCLRGKKGQSVAIGALERFVADWARANPAVNVPVAPSGKRVAVVGAGPGGLTCAGELAARGHAVTVFEAFHAAGGVLLYGIPEFRLPKDIVADEVSRLERAGVAFEFNSIIGRTWTIPELRAQFDAVFLAVGAGLPVFLQVPGENLKGVYSANEYLTRVNLMGANRANADTPILRGKRVAVVGGGNVAMDAVRVAKRLGAEATIILYRRGLDELPARAEEARHAQEEGIAFEFLAAPTAILGDETGWVRGVTCTRMMLGEPDAQGRRSPLATQETFEVPCDEVVVALGTRANPLLTGTTPGLATDARGYLAVDESGQSSIPGVFAGGDIVRGAATVILAMGDGKRAAASIDAYLGGTNALRPSATDASSDHAVSVATNG